MTLGARIARLPRVRLDASALGVLAALAATTLMRFVIGADRPFWLDEAQTGMLAMQPSWSEFVRQCTYDISAPLYYLLARLWAEVGGLSDHAMRLLPAAIGAAAPLIPLIAGRGLGRPTRLVWCVLLACWTPGLIFSQEARCYTLVLALGVGNTLAFVAWLENPDRLAAWRWAAISSLLILAHYFGGLMVALQGLIAVAVLRGRAVRHWPAALAFAPAVASVAVHAHRLITFTTPGTAWIPLVRPWGILDNAVFVAGGLGILLWLVILGVAMLFRGRQARGAARREPAWTAPALAAWAAATAAVIAVASGFIAPVFVERYLTAFVPGVLLGLTIIGVHASRRWPTAGGALALTMFAQALCWAIGPRPWHDVHTYNFEWASAALMRTHPSRLVFLWDNPMRPEPRQLAALGGFFFARAGQAVPVDPVVISSGQDPNRVLPARASTPGSVILWISDLGVRGTAAIRFRPAIARRDPQWLCRNFGDLQYRVMACAKDPATKAAFAAAPMRW